MSDIDHNNQVAKISLKEVADAIQRTPVRGDQVPDVNVTVSKVKFLFSHVEFGRLSDAPSKLNLPDTIQMTNGGTGPFKGSLLLINSGRGALPPSIALVNPEEPHNSTTILDNFFARQFNSLNDAKIHPISKKIFFTDVTCAHL